MKKRMSKIFLFLLAFGLAMPAFAKVSLYQMERNQMHRIQDGIYSGELTRREVRKLRRQQRNIHRLKDQFLRDGRLSRGERRALKKRYKRASRNIYRLKNNRHARYAYRSSPFSHRGNRGYNTLGFSFGHRF